MTSELEQVGSEHGAPCVRVKRIAAAPSAAVESEGPFQRRDSRFDAGAKVSKGTVGESVARHLTDLQAEVLAENNVPDAQRANVGEVLFGREATVEDDVARNSTDGVCRSFDGGHGKRRVGWIAGKRP